MKFKTLGDKISFVLTVCAIVALLYGAAYAIGINRIIGSNVVAGDGIRLGGDGKDTIEVFQGRGLEIDNDSLVILLGRGLSCDGDSVIVTAGDGLNFNNNNLQVLTGWGVYIDNDSVKTNISGTAGLDDSLVTLFSVQTISVVKGFTDTLRFGADGTDGLFSIYSEQGGTDYKVVVKPHGTMTQDIILTLPADDGGTGTYLKSDGDGNLSFDTPPGGDPGSAIHDSLWGFDQFWGGSDLAIRTGVDATIGVYYPLSNDSNAYFVRHVHEGTTDDELDTVVFAGYLPMGIDGSGVDSITYNIRTSDIADSSFIQVKVFKRDGDDLGALALCDSVAATATTAGAWEHKTTGVLGEAQADAGDVIEVWFIITFPSQTVGILAEHDKPKVWYTGR